MSIEKFGFSYSVQNVVEQEPDIFGVIYTTYELVPRVETNINSTVRGKFRGNRSEAIEWISQSLKKSNNREYLRFNSGLDPHIVPPRSLTRVKNKPVSNIVEIEDTNNVAEEGELNTDEDTSHNPDYSE